MADSEDKKAEGAEAQEASGGIKSFLPLILTVVLMPAMAFATTKFVLLPQIQSKVSGGAAQGSGSGKAKDKGSGGHGAASKDKGHGGGGGGGDDGHGGASPGANMHQITKVLVNVKNTGATRYLVTSFAVVGGEDHGNFKEMVMKREPQLRDVAMGIMMNLSIEDLAEIDIKNRVKVMMTSSFNDALGGEYVENIYFTEFAVQ